MMADFAQDSSFYVYAAMAPYILLLGSRSRTFSIQLRHPHISQYYYVIGWCPWAGSRGCRNRCIRKRTPNTNPARVSCFPAVFFYFLLPIPFLSRQI